MSKTWKAITKRIKVTKSKKLFRKSTGQSHFNTKEKGKTVLNKRRLIRVSAKLLRSIPNN